MALTSEQEASLLANLDSSKSAIEGLTAENAAFKAQLAEKDVAITALKTKTDLSSQEQALIALKATCPDVPETVLKALPEAVRAAEGAALQVHYGKLKSAPLKTGSEAWNSIGGIAPSVEAEDAAKLALRETARNAAVQKGDFMDVLRIKSRDTIEFIQKNFATR